MTSKENKRAEEKTAGTSGNDDSSAQVTRPAPEPDRTVTMILADAGKPPVELENSGRVSTSGKSRTIKKVLKDEDGIVTDDEKYDVKEILAKGGMGMIMAAKDLNIRRDVAVKVMLPEQGGEDGSLLRFVEEAQVTGQLEHPNIVPVHELGVQSTGQVFYTMKMIKGKTLKDIIKKIRKGDESTIKEFNLTRLMTIFMKVCDAVAFAHDHKVVHRDLKPENIMIGEFGEALVVDWGLAKILKQRSDDTITVDDIALDEGVIQSVRSVGGDEHVTMDGKIMGTPRYMAPEQIRGINANVDCRADIYSLGAILYNILTLHNHVEGKSVYDILKNSLIGAHVPIETYEADGNLPHWSGKKLPSGLKAVAEECLRTSPQARYQNVKDLQRDIEAWQEGYATQAEKASLLRQLTLLISRNKAAFSVAAASMLVLSVFGGYAVREVVKERDVANDARRRAEDAREVAVLERKKTAVALLEEEKAKQRALYERALAIEARENEKLAKEQEHVARKKAEIENYCNTLNLVNARIKDGSFNQAQSLLWALPHHYRHWEWGYLLNRSNPELFSINARGVVHVVAISPDGRLIAAGCSGGMIRIIDSENGKHLKSWAAHEYLVQSIAFSPDGRKILTNGNGKVACLWDVINGKKLLSLKVEGDVSIDSGIFSDDGRRIITVTGPNGRGTDGKNENVPVPLFGDAIKVPRKYTFPDYEAFTKAGDQIILQVEERAIQIWDANTGEPITVETETVGNFDSSAMFAENRRIAVVNLDETHVIQILDATSLKVLSVLRGHRDIVRSVVFSPDGSRALTASEDKTARLWDVKTGRQLAVYAGHNEDVYTAVFSLDGSLILTAGADKTIKIWKSDSNGSPVRLPAGSDTVDGAFSPDGKYIALAGYQAKICDKSTGKQLVLLEGDGNLTDSLTFSPDGTKVIGKRQGKGYMWEVATGRILKAFEADGEEINGIALAPDGKELVTVGSRGGVRLWDPSNGRGIRSSSVEGLRARSICYSPDGKRIGWWGSKLVRREGNVEIRKVRTGIWKVKAGKEMIRFEEMNWDMNYLSFSPDGNHIVVSRSRLANVIDLTTGDSLVSLRGHGGSVNMAIYSPDSKRIITASNDNTVRVWDASTGREYLNINDMENKARFIAFSPDGYVLLAIHQSQPPRLLEAHDWRMDKETYEQHRLTRYKAYLRNRVSTDAKP